MVEVAPVVTAPVSWLEPPVATSVPWFTNGAAIVLFCSPSVTPLALVSVVEPFQIEFNRLSPTTPVLKLGVTFAVVPESASVPPPVSVAPLLMLKIPPVTVTVRPVPIVMLPVLASTSVPGVTPDG
jgi:hypothetical protein